MTDTDKLRLVVKEELQKCTPTAYPQINKALRGGVKEYKRVEELVISTAIQHNLSISAAINLIEQEELV